MLDRTSQTRRQFFGSTAAVSCAPFVLGGLAGPRCTVRGVVFHDRKRAGTRHAGDPGIPGVLVSNGVDVVKTDSDGLWQLEARPGDQIFVIKPAGWDTHRRAGSLPDFFRPVRPGQNDSVEFPLIRCPEPAQHDILLLADTQPQCAQELGYLSDSILAAAARSNAAFAINHGDVVFDDLSLYQPYIDRLGATGLLWHHCPGNHDMDPGTENQPASSFETWSRTFGPCHYAFQHGGATYIILNNVERLARGELTPGGYGYHGRLGARQLAFVRNLLAHVPEDGLVVASMHIPLVSLEDPHEPSCFTRDRTALLQLLSRRPHTVSFAGHTHTTEHHYLGAENGFAGPDKHHHHVLTAACGSWWSGPFDASGLPVAESRDGTPKGFHILHVNGPRYMTSFVPVGSRDGSRLRVSVVGMRRTVDLAGVRSPIMECRSVLSRDELPSASIVANIFDGGPRTEVALQIFGRGDHDVADWGATMQPLYVPDPVTIENYHRHAAKLKPWVCATPSSHLWAAALPPNAPAGSYVAVVDAVNEYGQRFSERVDLEIVD